MAITKASNKSTVGCNDSEHQTTDIITIELELVSIQTALEGTENQVRREEEHVEDVEAARIRIDLDTRAKSVGEKVAKTSMQDRLARKEGRHRRRRPDGKRYADGERAGE